MPTILLDRFNDTDGLALGSHTPNIGPGGGPYTTAINAIKIETSLPWTAGNNSGDSTCAQCLADTTGNYESLAYFDCDVSDCTITCFVSTNNTTAPAVNINAYVAILFRYLDSNNLWAAIINLEYGNGTSATLYKKVTGSYTLKTDWSTGLNGWTTAHWGQIKIELLANSIKIYTLVSQLGESDWVERVNVTDTHNQTATKHGLAFYSSGTNPGPYAAVWQELKIFTPGGNFVERRTRGLHRGVANGGFI